MKTNEHTPHLNNKRELKDSIKIVIKTPQKSSQLLAAATLFFMIPKMVLLIPHFIVLWFLRIAAFFVGVLGQVIVLFTGSYPPEMHQFLVGVLRWQLRVNAYFFGLRDEYPDFTLKE